MVVKTDGLFAALLLTEHQEDTDDQVQVYSVQTRGCGSILSGGNIRVIIRMENISCFLPHAVEYIDQN